MADLLALSNAVIDDGKGVADVGPINRINHELSSIAPGIAVVEAFSHCVLFETDAGLLAFDTSSHAGGAKVVEAIRKWRPHRFHTIVYTHGHLDHVGGAGAFIAAAEARRQPRPRVVGHENVARRFERYRLTDGYNRIINARQFGQFARHGYSRVARRRWPRPAGVDRAPPQRRGARQPRAPAAHRAGGGTRPVAGPSVSGPTGPRGDGPRTVSQPWARSERDASSKR